MKILKKFDLPIETISEINKGRIKVQMPFNSEIVGFVDLSKPSIMALIDDQNREIERWFVVVAQGQPVDARFNRTHYVGSFEVKADIGTILCSVFEER